MRAQLIKCSEDYAVMSVVFVRNRWDEETDSPVKYEETEVIQLLDPYHRVTEVGAWYDITTTPVFHKFKDENGKLCKEVMLFIVKAEVSDVQR